MGEQPVQNLQQASTSPNVAGALQQLLLSRMPTPDQEYWQREGRQDQLEQYQSALRQPAQTGYTPTEHSLYSMINSFGPGTPTGYAALKGIAAGGMQLGKNAQTDRQGEIDAAKVGYEDVKLDGKEDLLALKLASSGLKGGAAGKFIQFSDDAGNKYIMNNATGQREMIPASKSKMWEAANKAGYDHAVTNKMENPEDYGIEYANRIVGTSPKGTAPVDTVQKQQVPVGTLTPEPGTPAPPKGSGGTAGTNNMPAGSKEDNKLILMQEWDLAAKAAENYRQYPESPQYQEALRNQAALRQELKTSYGVDPMKAPEVKSPAPIAPAPNLKYKDERVEAQQKGYGGKEGEGLFKERQSLTDLHAANTKLIGQLDALERVYSDPNIPQGELANLQQQIRSGLVTLGVPGAKEVGVTDFAKALGTSLSLTQKNADGHNLLPGAMSNYEDQLLQKMAPTLSLTNEGRVMLVQFMKQVAASNMRIAQEGTKMAGENKDMLPSNWYQRKERVMREEMAKLKILSDKLIKAGGPQ
jgi:hypothetical protein